MLQYIKYILVIFGFIGLLIIGFFSWQNKTDLSTAFEYREKFQYDELVKNCPNIQDKYVYPCLKKAFKSYLSMVSLTGTSIGMKMVFSTIDEDKKNQNFFKSKNLSALHYSLNYLEINNLAMNNAYQRYFGIKGMYGGYVSSLRKFYDRAFEFSENILLGLQGSKGIQMIKNVDDFEKLQLRLTANKKNYFKIKKKANQFIDFEMKRLLSNN